MAVFTFYGDDRIIQVEDTGDHDFTAQEVYSRWKDWVQASDNSKYEIAFRSVAGDQVSPTTFIAPYVFLNTTAGWRIRCHDGDHVMRIDGNLYSEDPDLPMFTPPLDGATVEIIVERSVNAVAISAGGGLDEQGVRDAMTAQGYTTARAPKLDQLDAAVSTRATPGQGLTTPQATSLSTIESRADVATSTRAAAGESAAALSDVGATSIRVAKLDELDAAISSRAAPGQGLTSGQDSKLSSIDGRVDVAVSTRATPGQGLTSPQATQLSSAAADAALAKINAAAAEAAALSLAGQGLTDQQATMILEMYRILGLDPTKPLVHEVDSSGNGSRTAGAEIEQDIATISGGLVVVTRT